MRSPVKYFPGRCRHTEYNGYPKRMDEESYDHAVVVPLVSHNLERALLFSWKIFPDKSILIIGNQKIT